MSLIVPTFESETLELGFHSIINRRKAKPYDAMIACLALYVKAGIEGGYSEEQLLMLVRARFRSPNADGTKL